MIIKKCLMCEKYKCTWFTPMIQIEVGDDETGEKHRFYACESHFVFASTQDIEKELGVNHE